MIVHYKTALVDITGLKSLHVHEQTILINLESCMQSSISVESRDTAIKHIKTIADHLRDKKEICYLVDENDQNS